MSDINVSWFHCGRCGTLFQSAAGDMEDRTCSACGRQPSLGIEVPPAAIPTAPVPNEGAPRQEPGHRRSDREKHTSKRRKSSHFILKLVGGWLLLVGGIVFGARLLWPDEAKVTSAPAVVAGQIQQRNEAEESMVTEAAPACSRLFQSFVTAESPEMRMQLVHSPVRTTPRMARYNTFDSSAKLNPEDLKLSAMRPLRLPGHKAIESQWTHKDGQKLDVVFLEENGAWKIDWDHLVRYGDLPWAFFLAGSGDSHSEFRLLARERLATERRSAENISMILYAPRFGNSSEAGFASPEFVVSRSSKNGKMLEEAFDTERAGKRAYGVDLPSIDPEGFIRVRVKVKRLEDEGGRKFELEDVVACHWYTSDDPGVALEDQPRDD